ncbi:hypothetical protein CC2G_008087 [Coprinopsis cinerea AmutBmut pab1-1]|nr:hypothetical protein CC2G_008087 [Coprinopsis cinerea AmutBmut pab1-1]
MQWTLCLEATRQVSSTFIKVLFKRHQPITTTEGARRNITQVPPEIREHSDISIATFQLSERKRWEEASVSVVGRSQLDNLFYRPIQLDLLTDATSNAYILIPPNTHQSFLQYHYH